MTQAELFPLSRPSIRRHCAECGAPVNREPGERFVPGGAGRPRRFCPYCRRERLRAQKRAWRAREIEDYPQGRWLERQPPGCEWIVSSLLCDVEDA